jgi:hypothetical protein
VLLALDISTSTGAAWGGPDEGRPRTALYELDKRDFDRALCQLDEAVGMLCRFEKVTHMVFEASMRQINADHGYQSAFVLISLQAVARRSAKRNGCIVHPVDVGTWRKHWIGSGNLPGDVAKRMCREQCDRMRWPYQNTDVAEACGIWAYGMAKYFPKWNPVQFKVGT